MRGYSSVHTQQPAGPVREIEMDPYLLLDDDIKYVTQDIREVSIFKTVNMNEKSYYYLCICWDMLIISVN